ncbi:uncharacterized protein LOC134196396 [Corticium candelabrum]|uniref:uncharacterized protein LOC134196396 n=1 Tax=Corticium candelabrum TaxID=121492 RepID=UPI002E26E29D|nr:uncharacterized protein LOC134196396 [Corticium candelabrum]
MAGLPELYGVEDAQELLSRLRPREKRARRIHVNRLAIRQQLEKEGVPTWNVQTPEQQEIAKSKESPVPVAVNTDELRAQQEESVIMEPIVPEIVNENEPQADNDLDLQEGYASSLSIGSNEVIQTTPTEFLQPQLTSTPCGHGHSLPPRRRVVSSLMKTHDNSISLQDPKDAMAQILYECEVSTLSQSASAAAECETSEGSGVVELVEVGTQQTAVRGKTTQKQRQHQTQEDEDLDELGGDQEVTLLAIDSRTRSAASITDLDVAMTVVKRVCLDYGNNSESYEQEAIRSFYQHVKKSATKAIGDLCHLNEVRRELNKLKKDRKKQMENVIYLQHHKAKIDMHLKRQREQMADLTDKRDKTESCLKFLKGLEQLKLRLSLQHEKT